MRVQKSRSIASLSGLLARPPKHSRRREARSARLRLRRLSEDRRTRHPEANGLREMRSQGKGGGEGISLQCRIDSERLSSRASRSSKSTTPCLPFEDYRIRPVHTEYPSPSPPLPLPPPTFLAAFSCARDCPSPGSRTGSSSVTTLPDHSILLHADRRSRRVEAVACRYTSRTRPH
ncbi:hypothetical protein BDW22DRAFT_862925 [Trametopsis cervina]|nr:hypothetical protein BDW22DRAFT_862925 [Trametopsis cervina]